MDLKARLDHDMKEALRAGDRVRLGVIRMIRAAVKNAEIAAGKALDDAGVLEVLVRELKLRQESLAEYERAGRSDEVARLQREIEIVRGYLPEPLSEAEIVELARRVIAEVGAVGPQDMGKVMGRLMAEVRGRAEGGLVSRIVREELARIQQF